MLRGIELTNTNRSSVLSTPFIFKHLDLNIMTTKTQSDDFDKIREL